MISESSRKRQEEETYKQSRKDRLVDFTSLDKQQSSLTELDIRDIRELSQVSKIPPDMGRTEANLKFMDDATEEVWTTWKARKKEGGEKVVKHCIDYILYAPPCRHMNVGVRALGVLDLLRNHEVGPDFLPSSSYPSDHIAIAADLEIIRMTNYLEIEDDLISDDLGKS
jgi:hypothetical protein